MVSNTFLYKQQLNNDTQTMKNTLNQLLMLNKTTKNTIMVINGTLNIHPNITENIVNEIINDIKRTNKETHLMYILKIIFYDYDYAFNLMECHYLKMMNILSIVFCVMVDCQSTQKYVWQQECLKRETRNAKMQEKCKDNQNNKNNRNNVNGALYFNQCVLKFDSINRLFNGSNINIQWINMFKINGNGATESVDVKLDRILSGDVEYIVVLKFLIPILAFRTTAHNYLFIARCELFLKLSLSFISLLLDYVTQLFIELLLIDTTVIITMIEMFFLYQLYALSVQMVETTDRIIPNVTTHNIVAEFFKYDAASINCVERGGDLEAGQK